MSASGTTFTAAQRAAILAEGHVLLEAGAGSGKTTTLVGKILHALGAEVIAGERVERPCELADVVAITFTTAAAADLRQSLRARLRDQAASGDRRWRRMVYEVDRARIGTIHSFCGQILRDFALREGLDPAFRILDAGEAAELREGCARDALYEALAHDEDVADLALARGITGAVTLVHDAMTAGDAALAARRAWCDDAGIARTNAIRDRVTALGGVWRPHDDDGARLAAAVLRVAHEAQAAFERELDLRGALDYDAMISRTRDLLARSADVRDAVRARTRWLFIDEFQDTDPAQRDIAYLLCGIRDALAGVLPFRRCPTLCIVGDPKQSIYGFRRADVTLWNAVARDLVTLGGPGAVIPLDANFRSRAPILGLVNATFGALMPDAQADDVPDHEVRWRALDAAIDDAGDDDLVELLALPDGLGAPERRAEEARRIARHVRALVDGGQSIVRDRDGTRRAAGWRDVALLFRASGDVRLYEAELRRAGVPCWVVSGDGFFAAREIRDARLLLAALADAHDDVAWLGLLRSPWVGLSDDALLRLRTERPKLPFSRTLDVSLPGADGEALAFAREWIEELRLLRDRVPCAALLERALERSGYAAAALLQPGGDGALANLRKLVRMADALPDESLAGFVAHLSERGRSATREAEAALHTAGEDVVTLCTVHGAKGLEWPVVFLCDLDRDPVHEHEPFYMDAADGIALRLEDPEAEKGEQACGAWECLQRRAAERGLAENKRVWYVAGTRARDRLVLCAMRPAPGLPDESVKKPKLTAARWLLASLALDGATFTYACGGRSWRGRVIDEASDASIADLAPPAPPTWEEILRAPASPLPARVLA